MRDLVRSLAVLLVMTIVTGIVYPLTIWVISQTAFPFRANGSIIRNENHDLGSVLIGQHFTSPRYFHGRPSDVNCDAGGSGASNLGPVNPHLLTLIRDRLDRFRVENDLAPNTPVPADAVLGSASGLDPDLGLDAALLQVPRVARNRRMDADRLAALVRSHATTPSLLNGSRALVNILELNLLLDRMEGK